MESAKEKAIREAWAEHYDFVKVNLEFDGSFWVYEYQTELYEWCKKNTKCIQQTFAGTSRFIPWKIIGIETNFGWTRFEGSSTLPSKECNYVLGKFVRGAFRHIEGQNLMRAKHALVSMQYTHYREQHNYPTPIY